MTLLEKYIIARWCYAIGEDFISDMEYRGIEDILKKEEPENEYINRSWSDDPCPVELLRKYNMLHLIRNVEFIHKSESIPSINSEEKYKERYFDCEKVCSDYACRCGSYPAFYALARTGIYWGTWFYVICHFLRFHVAAICIFERIPIP